MSKLLILMGASFAEGELISCDGLKEIHSLPVIERQQRSVNESLIVKSGDPIVYDDVVVEKRVKQLKRIKYSTGGLLGGHVVHKGREAVSELIDANGNVYYKMDVLRNSKEFPEQRSVLTFREDGALCDRLEERNTRYGISESKKVISVDHRAEFSVQKNGFQGDVITFEGKDGIKMKFYRAKLGSRGEIYDGRDYEFSSKAKEIVIDEFKIRVISVDDAKLTYEWITQ